MIRNMMVLTLENRSVLKQLYRPDALRRILARIAAGEKHETGGIVHVVFCDDAEMAALNRKYRKARGATDVLAFAYKPVPGCPGTKKNLGDIILSLETIERRCAGDLKSMRFEVRLLFCHGVLHLLGYRHDSAAQCRSMAEKQARYLGVTPEEAWLIKH